MTHMKPHAAAFRALADAVGVDPSRAVFVGDRLRDDVSGARAVGMRTVHLVGRPVEGFDVVPDAELDSLDGLVELVGRLARERLSAGRRRQVRTRRRVSPVLGTPRGRAAQCG
jgi:beta-phosphoglucomutase-like phosphatase (HAD superfamily)